MISPIDLILEFVPLVGGLGIIILVPLLELPIRRFLFPFTWASLGYLSAKPLTEWVLVAADLHGRKPATLIFFQGGTLLAIAAIAVGESIRGVRTPWRALVASLGAMSVATMWLSSRVLEGWGPNADDLGTVGAWVGIIGYIAGPSALAAFAFLMMVHRIELYEELGR
jgi:hypothetical protein